MRRRWMVALLVCVTLSSCAKHIAAPVNEALLAAPPHSVKLVSSTRNGRGPGGIGGFETSASAFVVYASTDPLDILVAWYKTLAAVGYRYNIQERGATVEITLFSKRHKNRTGNVTLTGDLPTDIIHAYTSDASNPIPLAPTPPGTKTYIAVAVGDG